MASGLNPRGQGERTRSTEGRGSETVTLQEETEDVVHSFMFNSLQQQQNMEAETMGEILTPTVPEVVPRNYNPISSTARVGQQLAVIGDQINIQYASVFKEMIEELKLTPATAYATFREIAKRLFDQGINWGRIIALLCFGYRISAEMFKFGWQRLFPQIINFVTRYIFEEGPLNWIAQHGGWIAVLSERVVPNAEMSWFNVGAILTLASICVGVVYVKSRHS